MILQLPADRGKRGEFIALCRQKVNHLAAISLLNEAWLFSHATWRQRMFKQILIASFVASAFAVVPATSISRTIVITQAPPPPRDEPMPAARRGQEWAPGHWVWRNGQHVWVSGKWLRERRGSHWVPDQGVERNGRWHLVAGHWARGARAGGRDRDGDGVPNRQDARPNNPNKS
jgi:hypothetical protein